MQQLAPGRLLLVFAACLVALANQASGVDLVGYLPHYRMNANYNANTLPGQLPMLDEIRYFGLTAADNGTVAPLDGSGSLTANENRIMAIKDAINQLPAADRPRLNITLGGAGEAAGFAAIAANANLRDAFAQDIKALLDRTGATSVDLDWEHPQGTAQFNNYKTLLQRIKQELGPDRRVYATIDPTIGLSPTVLDGEHGIDGISLMTYDLSWWANDTKDTNRGEHSLPIYVEDAFEAWTQPAGSPNQRSYVFGTWGRNAPAEKMGIGLPFYGRAIGTPQAPKGEPAYTYSELVAGGVVTDEDGNYYTYANNPVWVAGPEIVEQRIQFAHDNDLQNVIIWEIGQDLSPSHEDSLLRTAYEKKLSLENVVGDFNGDREVDLDDYREWVASLGNTGNWSADGNLDGVVNAADYVVWRRAVSVAGQIAAPSAEAQLVPEPSAAAWFMMLLPSAIMSRPIRK